MWPTSARFSPLLPSDYNHSPIKHVSQRRRAVLIVSLLSTVVIIAGAIRTFDLEFTFASKRPDIMSPEIPDDIIATYDPVLTDNPPIISSPTDADESPSPDVTQNEPVYFSKEHLSTDEMKDMVSRTKGFYTREYSLGLGWNNVRYIIEASVLQARLLNRTLILPSFVYARSCAYEISVCADQVPMLNKGEAIGWADWRKLPIEQQMGWQIPISVMLNITQLRRFQPVITAAEYFQYAGLPKTLETSSGYWDRSAYHQSSDPRVVHSEQTQGKPTLFVIENGWYDPDNVTRVDAIPDAMKERGGWMSGNESVVQTGQWESRDDDAAHLFLRNLLPNNKIVEWNEAQSAVAQLAAQMPEAIGLDSMVSRDLENDEFVEEVLNQHGFEVLYTFQGAAGMDFVKHVVMPMRQVALRSSIRGFVEDYSNIDADIVVLAGETHLFRKPGQMRFTTRSTQELFQRVVLHHVVPLDKVYDLARKLDFRISEMNNGRQWLASHIRRGDFVTAGWAWGGESHIGHLERVMEHLDQGRKLLQSERPYSPYSIPDIIPDGSIPHRDPPEEGDGFFIATDESDPEKLRYFSEQGAIMFRDLVSFDDRHEFGWGILFSDIIGLVEQATLARASYFYGSAMSSFTGGVFNMRATLGAEESTALAD